MSMEALLLDGSSSSDDDDDNDDVGVDIGGSSSAAAAVMASAPTPAPAPTPAGPVAGPAAPPPPVAAPPLASPTVTPAMPAMPVSSPPGGAVAGGSRPSPSLPPMSSGAPQGAARPVQQQPSPKLAPPQAPTQARPMAGGAAPGLRAPSTTSSTGDPVAAARSAAAAAVQARRMPVQQQAQPQAPSSGYAPKPQQPPYQPRTATTAPQTASTASGYRPQTTSSVPGQPPSSSPSMPPQPTSSVPPTATSSTAPAPSSSGYNFDAELFEPTPLKEVIARGIQQQQQQKMTSMSSSPGTNTAPGQPQVRGPTTSTQPQTRPGTLPTRGPPGTTSPGTTSHPGVPSTSSSAVSQSQAEKESKQRRDKLFLFTRVLLKYLEQKDPAMNQRVRVVIRECYEKNKAKDPAYQSLTRSMHSRLRATVGEAYWKKAEEYLWNHLYKQKLAAQQKAKADAARGGAPAPGTVPSTGAAAPGGYARPGQTPTQASSQQPQRGQPPQAPSAAAVQQAARNAAAYQKPTPQQPQAQGQAFSSQGTAAKPPQSMAAQQTQAQAAVRKPPNELEAKKQEFAKAQERALAFAKSTPATMRPGAATVPPPNSAAAAAAAAAAKKKKVQDARRNAKAAAMKASTAAGAAPGSTGATSSSAAAAVAQAQTFKMAAEAARKQSQLGSPPGTAGVQGMSHEDKRKQQLMQQQQAQQSHHMQQQQDGQQQPTAAQMVAKKRARNSKKGVMMQQTQGAAGHHGHYASSSSPKRPRGQPKVYDELMEMVDHSVVYDWSSAAQLLSKDYISDVDLDEEQRNLLYGGSRRGGPPVPSAVAKSVVSSSDVRVEGSAAPPSAAVAAASSSTAAVKETAIKPGWSKQHLVSVRIAWARIRLPEFQRQQQEASAAAIAQDRVKEGPMAATLNPLQEGKPVPPFAVSSSSLGPPTSSSATALSPFSTWHNEEMAEQDPVLALLSHATQIYMKTLLEGGVSISRKRHNLDAIRLWHLQHGRTRPPLTLRLGCDVRRQTALAAGNAAKICQRMEEALARSGGFSHRRTVSWNEDEDTAVALDGNKRKREEDEEEEREASEELQMTCYESVSMGDLSKRIFSKETAERMAKEAALDSGHSFEVYGGRDSGKPPFGRVPKRGRIMTGDFRACLEDPQFPFFSNRQQQQRGVVAVPFL